MFCPQCGQQQISGAVRFCSRCGFPMDGVIHLLANSGMLPVYRSTDEPTQISPRKRGVRQGMILLLTGALLVPILGVLSSYSNSTFLEVLLALAAIICFVGGPLRMLFAAVFEEGAQNKLVRPYVASPVPAPHFAPQVQRAGLPPPAVQPPMGWQSRPTTAELVGPTSVTEHTTRLLNKEESERS
jgi:hypothetical protein